MFKGGDGGDPGHDWNPWFLGCSVRKAPWFNDTKARPTRAETAEPLGILGIRFRSMTLKKTLGYSAGFMTLWGWDYMILIPNFLRNPSSMNKDYSWTFLFFPEVRAIGIFFRNLWVLVLWSRQLSLTFVVLVQPCWSRTRYYVYIYIHMYPLVI